VDTAEEIFKVNGSQVKVTETFASGRVYIDGSPVCPVVLLSPNSVVAIKLQLLSVLAVQMRVLFLNFEA